MKAMRHNSILVAFTMTTTTATALAHSSLAFAADCVIPPQGIVHWWRAENNAEDQIGASNGSLTSGARFAVGKVGRAFVFDGTSGAVSAPDSDSWNFGRRDFTIDLWVRFGAIVPRSPFISSDDGGGNRRKWIFWYDELGDGGAPGPALRFAINAPRVGGSNPISAPWSPTIGVWHHVAVTRASETYSLYVNGVKAAETTNTATVPNASLPLQIGAAEGFHHSGAIDEIDIYDRAVSSAEIAAIYASQSVGKCPIVGGQYKGIEPTSSSVTCQNLTTGQRIQFTLPRNVKSWDCGEAGLSVRRGDSLDMFMRTKGTAK